MEEAEVFQRSTGLQVTVMKHMYCDAGGVVAEISNFGAALLVTF